MTKNNIAFVDGQNLHMGIKSSKKLWKIDLAKFRIYLKAKYNISEAYYFLGYLEEKYQDLYNKIQKAGFIILFKQHSSAMVGKKKGNVDSDIIFHVMRKLYQKEKFDKIILVSGDGDYKMLVDFLIKEKKFSKILFPNKQFSSSLYKKLLPQYYDYLENNGVKQKIKK